MKGEIEYLVPLEVENIDDKFFFYIQKRIKLSKRGASSSIGPVCFLNGIYKLLIFMLEKDFFEDDLAFHNFTYMDKKMFFFDFHSSRPLSYFMETEKGFCGDFGSTKHLLYYSMGALDLNIKMFHDSRFYTSIDLEEIDYGEEVLPTEMCEAIKSLHTLHLHQNIDSTIESLKKAHQRSLKL